MLSKEKKLEKRKQIAKSTCNLFIKKGFVNISISEIADVAGIGKGTVYQYFCNKEDIVFELMSCLQEEYDQVLNKNLSQSADPKEKLKYLFSLYLNDDLKVQTQRDIYREFLAITLNNPSVEIIDYQNRMMEKYTIKLREIFQEAIAQKQLQIISLEFIPSIFATMDGFFIGRESKEEILKYIDNLFFLIETKG